MNRPRLLLADDHTLVVEGIRKLLESDFDLVGTAEDGRELLRAADSLEPDLVLADISMPLLNGIDACRELHRLHPKIKVVILTMHADPIYVQEALRAGASGYLLKRSAAKELTEAIETALGGKTYVTAEAGLRESVGANGRKKRPGKPGKPKTVLTARQREVLQLIAEGHSNKEIAGILHISEKTAEFHKASIMRVLGLRSTAQLTKFAIKHGLTEA